MTAIKSKRSLKELRESISVPGIFEMDAMRQAFFKRQAKHFFDNEAEQQAYIEHAEKEYLEATVTLKDILFNSKNGTQKANKSCLIEKFEEAMQ